jgi:hypothetical protein
VRRQKIGLNDLPVCRLSFRRFPEGTARREPVNGGTLGVESKPHLPHDLRYGFGLEAFGQPESRMKMRATALAMLRRGWEDRGYYARGKRCWADNDR